MFLYLFLYDTLDEPTKKPRILPCNCHSLLLGIQNVLEIANNVSLSGKPNRDLIRHPVGFLNTKLWKEQPTLISTFRIHQSADENSEFIEEYINNELANGNLVGPLPTDHGLNIIIRPIGSVPKPGSKKRRTIVDSSFPPGHEVNDSIPKNM